MTDRKHLISIGIAAVLGATIAVAWGGFQEERFSATTVVAVAPAESVVQDADVIDVVGGLDRGTIVETLAGLSASSSVTSAAAANSGIDPVDAGDYEVDAVRAVGSNLVDITASGPDAEVVAALSTSTAQMVAAQFNTLYRVYRVDVVTAADVPSSSDRPSLALVGVAGAVAAGLAASLVAAATESRRRRRHLESVRPHDETERLAS